MPPHRPDSTGMAKQNPTTTAAATLPAQIEIFRAGQHTDDAGVVHNFSAADVAGMVAAYKPALREAPLTIGHPADNLPAYGWVRGLAVNAAGNLAMDVHQVQPQFAEMVSNKLFKKRSASFYPPGHANNPSPDAWYLRHVAFLGAQPPAIAGLADFAAGSGEGAVNFSSGDEPAAAQAVAPATPPLQTPAAVAASLTPVLTQEQIQMNEDLKAQLEAAKTKQAETDAALLAAKATGDAAAAQLAQFAEKAKADRTAGFASFAEGVKPEVLLPKDRPMVVAALEALADAKPVSFAEGGATKTVSPAEWLKTFVSTRAPVVSFGEHAPGNAGAGAGQGNAGLTEQQIHDKAVAYQRANKVSYAEAATAVCSFTS
jgi:hypothetical protein